MVIGNFAFKAADSQPRSLELGAEECELCKSDAAGAALCGSCADMIRSLLAIRSKENQPRSRVAASGA